MKAFFSALLDLIRVPLRPNGGVKTDSSILLIYPPENELDFREYLIDAFVAAKHIPMVLVKNAYNEARQAFIRIKDRNAVLSFRPVRVLNKPQAANQKPPNRAVSSPTNRTAWSHDRAA